MDDTNINIRIFAWHIQLRRGELIPNLSYNCYHKENNFADGYFKIYNFFGYRQD
jgi:hypothetical protein